MEKLEIIINEMMADDGPVPIDLGNVGTHDAKMTQSDSDTSNAMRPCVRSLGKGTKPARDQARKDRTDQRCGILEKELMNGRVAEEMTVERKEVRRARRLYTRPVRGAKGSTEKKGKGKGKRENRYCYDS